MTSSGRWLAGLGAGACVLGVAVGYPSLVALAVGFGAALVVALLWVRGTRELEASVRVTPAAVSRGAEVVVTATVTNRSRRRVPAQVAELGGRLAAVTVDLPPIAGRGTVRPAVTMLAGRRGVWQLGPVVVVRSDPLGLLARTVDLGGRATLRVRPRVHPLRPLSSSEQRGLDAATPGRLRAGSAEFDALREYFPGDDPRRVHWPSSARAGRLHVRTQLDPVVPTVAVLLDCHRASYPVGRGGEQAFEEAVEVAASIAAAYHERRLAARLRDTAGLVWPAPHSRGGLGELLDSLAAVATHTAPALGPALDALRRESPAAALVVVTGPGSGDLPTAVRRPGPGVSAMVVVEVGAADEKAGPPVDGHRVLGAMTLLRVRDAGELVRAWTSLGAAPAAAGAW